MFIFFYMYFQKKKKLGTYFIIVSLKLIELEITITNWQLKRMALQ